MGKENEQERLRKEAELKEKIRKDAARDLAEIVETHSYLLGESSEVLQKSGIHGRVFEDLAKHDPSVPQNKEENLQSLNKKLLIGLMEIDGGWLYNGKSGHAHIPDRFLMSYQEEAQKAIVTGVVEITSRLENLEAHKSEEFIRNPLNPLKTQFKKINQLLQRSAKGYLISPPVKEIVFGLSNKTELYLVVPRGMGETGTILFDRWEVVESIFTREEVESITQKLFASNTLEV